MDPLFITDLKPTMVFSIKKREKRLLCSKINQVPLGATGSAREELMTNTHQLAWEHIGFGWGSFQSHLTSPTGELATPIS